MYSGEIRKQVIKDIFNGISVAEVAEKNSISKPTIYNWIKKEAIDAKFGEEIIKELVKLDQIEQGINLCKNPFYIKNSKTQIIIEKLLKEQQRKKYLSEVFHKIRNSEMTLSELKASSLDEFEKLLLSILFYEKKDKKQGIALIKTALNNSDNYSKEQQKALQMIFHKLKKKNSFIDYDFYKKMIDRFFLNKINIDTRKEKFCSANSMEQNKSHIQTSTEDAILIESSISSLDTENPKTLKKTKKEKNKRSQVLKDLYPTDVMKINKYIYSQTPDDKKGNKAIEALDRFYVLCHKPVTDEVSHQKLVHIIGLYNAQEQYKITQQKRKKVIKN